MAVSKTKAKLVDVARQLFAKMGVENTTMNDIALASKKGRRTLFNAQCRQDIAALRNDGTALLNEGVRAVA